MHWYRLHGIQNSPGHPVGLHIQHQMHITITLSVYYEITDKISLFGPELSLNTDNLHPAASDKYKLFVQWCHIYQSLLFETESWVIVECTNVFRCFLKGLADLFLHVLNCLGPLNYFISYTINMLNLISAAKDEEWT